MQETPNLRKLLCKYRGLIGPNQQKRVAFQDVEAQIKSARRVLKRLSREVEAYFCWASLQRSNTRDEVSYYMI